MDPPWLQVPLGSAKRKMKEISLSPRNNSELTLADLAGGSGSKRLKLDDADNDSEDKDHDSIMLADGFEKVMTRDERRKMKKESAKAAQKAVSLGLGSYVGVRVEFKLMERQGAEETACPKLCYRRVPKWEEYHDRREYPRLLRFPLLRRIALKSAFIPYTTIVGTGSGRTPRDRQYPRTQLDEGRSENPRSTSTFEQVDEFTIRVNRTATAWNTS